MLIFRLLGIQNFKFELFVVEELVLAIGEYYTLFTMCICDGVCPHARMHARTQARTHTRKYAHTPTHARPHARTHTYARIHKQRTKANANADMLTACLAYII